jgi:hypothetical protein
MGREPPLAWSAARRASTKCFFQKHNTGSFGPARPPDPIEEKKGQIEDYVYVEAAPGIVACTQMGTIEFHGWGSSVADVEKPDRLVFDIDPDEGLSFDEVKANRRDIHRYLADMGLQSFPLTTGARASTSSFPYPGRGVARGQGFRPALRHRPRHRRARALHRQPRQSAAQGPDLPRLSSQPARSDRNPALFRPSPRAGAGGGADKLGRARGPPIRGALHGP